MGDLKFLINHYVSELWRRRWSMLLLAWLLALLGGGFAATRPDVYESQAQVFVNLRALLRDLLNDEAYIGNPIEDVENVRRLMYAKPNIRDIVHRTDLHLEAASRAEEEAIVNSVQEKISFTRKNRNHFFISFQHSDPEKARAVVQAMLDLFLEESYSRAGHSSETDEALVLAERDFRQVSAQLETVRAEIAEFERENPEALALPASVLSEKRRLESLLAQLRAEQTFREGELSRLRAELSSTPAEVVVRVVPGRVVREERGPPPRPPIEQRVPVPSFSQPLESQRYQNALARARQLQAEVDQLLRNYTAEYPGVREAQQRAAQAQAEADALGIAAQSATQQARAQIAAAEAHNRRVDQLYADYQRRLFDYQNQTLRETRTPDEEIYGPNPRRSELQSQIGSLESRLRVTQQEIASNRSELSNIQALMDRQPLKLQQYEALTTRRNDLEAKYRTIEARIDQLQATVRAAETELVRFEVIEAPTAPVKPIGPNRLILFAGAGLAALGIGFGQAFARVQLADTMPSTTHLRQAFDLPVLGGVSKFESAGVRARRMIGVVLWFVGAAALAAFLAGLVYVYHIKGARPELGDLLQMLKGALGPLGG